jgi:KUP system potassium uptake protein
MQGNTEIDKIKGQSGGSKKKLLYLSLLAIGIVYGDIGTSPLYSIRECFSGPHSIAATPDNIFGILSMVFWSLIFVISIKYLLIILKADHNGEGGILALMEFVRPKKKGMRLVVISTMGIFGAALLYGDGVITPAISVLSAVEGLTVATPFFTPFVIPITIVILVGLFMFQRKGTSLVGSVFGPLTVIWFLTIAALGVGVIIRKPEILLSLNPYYAFNFFMIHGLHGFVILGVVFLVVTGGEALYADIGHFGKAPIRFAWFAFVLPCLVLNCSRTRQWRPIRFTSWHHHGHCTLWW